MARSRSSRKEYLGIFDLCGDGKATGQLRVDGPSTFLELHADQPIGMIEAQSFLTGRSFGHEHLTLVDCVQTGMYHSGAPGKPTQYSARVLPGYVLVGPQHLDPCKSCIRAIHFSATDLKTVFRDFHAFGMIHDDKGTLERILKEQKPEALANVGEAPLIAYFSGRHTIIEVATVVGAVSAHHSLRYRLGNVAGVSIRDRIAIAIAPTTPMTFETAIAAMSDVALFLSVAAGRGQGITHIYLELDSPEAEQGARLQVHMSYPWRTSGASRRFRPHSIDMPLRPVEDELEFRSVITDWLARHEGWRTARNRYLSCLRQANRYGADRLIAAANMFDLLPKTSLPAATNLDARLAALRDDCDARFRELPDSPERGSVLSVLGRLGHPSLPKIVLHRVSMLKPSMEHLVPDLDWVAHTAIKCRNVYVHGRSKDFDVDPVEPFIPFLTDALEFIFGASDLLESGWNCSAWLKRGGFAGGHNFSRFLFSYKQELAALKGALAKPGERNATTQ